MTVLLRPWKMHFAIISSAWRILPCSHFLNQSNRAECKSYNPETGLNNCSTLSATITVVLIWEIEVNQSRHAEHLAAFESKNTFDNDKNENIKTHNKILDKQTNKQDKRA